MEIVLEEKSMNVGKFLVWLGYVAPPERLGFPCPTVIRSRESSVAPVSYGDYTAGEIEVNIDYHKTVGERATTKRSPGNWS